MIRLRTIFGQVIRVQAHFCQSQKPDQPKTLFMNPKPQLKNFGAKDKKKSEEHNEVRDTNSPKQLFKSDHQHNKKYHKQASVLFANKKTEEAKPKIDIEKEQQDDLYNSDKQNELFGESQARRQNMFFQPEESELERVSVRQFNTILKKKKEIQKQDEDELQKLIGQAKNIKDEVERSIHLMQIYGQHQMFKNVRDIFASSKQFNSGVYGAYILQLTNWSKEVADYQEVKKILLDLQDKAATLKEEVFLGVYQMIFNLPLYPIEKMIELEFLIQFSKTHNLKANYQIQQLLSLLSEYQPNYDQKTLKKAVTIFGLYFERFVNKNKGKIDLTKFQLRIAFCQAVQLTVLQRVDYAKPLLQNIKNMQILAEKAVDESDLVRYGQYLSTQANSFPQLVDLLKGVRSVGFIFNLEKALKMLDENGQEVQCVNSKEQLEEFYFQKNHQLLTRQLELFALFADRLDHPALITEIFKEQKQNKQNEYSSFIYLKAIVVLINNSDSTNLSNGVSQLIQEAKKNKVSLPRMTQMLYQIKGAIKEGKYNVAEELFNRIVIKDVVIEFQKEKITRFLLKYIQTNLIGYEFTAENVDYEGYLSRLIQVVDYIKSLPPDYYFNLYREERNDNFLLQSLIGQEDMFEFNYKKKVRDAFHKFQQDVQHRRFDFTKLINPETEEEKLQREIFDNYSEYVQIEKGNLIDERRNDRIYSIINQIDEYYFRNSTHEEVLVEIINAFGRKALEKDLLHSDVDEFPESELVLQLQLKFAELFAEKNLAYEKYPVTKLNWEDNAMNNFIQQTQKAAQIAWKKSQNDKLSKGKKQEVKTTNQKLDELLDETIKQNDELQGYKTDLSNVHEWKEYLRQIILLSEHRKKLPQSKQFLSNFISVHYQQGKQDTDMIDETYEGLENVDKESRKEIQNEEFAATFDMPTAETLYFSQDFQNTDFLQLKYMYYNGYMMNDKYIHVPPSHYQSEIWDLLAWGLKNDEPMAIKLTEQYCNLVGAKMPEYLAKMVANFYKYKVGEQDSPIRKKWIKCLELVTNVNMTKVYQHVTDPAFISEEDIDFLHSAELRQEYKGVCRSLLNTTYSNRKFLRYGVSQRELLM